MYIVLAMTNPANTRETVAAKLFTMLPEDVRSRADLRFGSISLGRGMSVVVDTKGISIFSNYDAACEHIAPGLSYRAISAHITGVMRGTVTSALPGSKVLMASGGGWIAA